MIGCAAWQRKKILRRLTARMVVNQHIQTFQGHTGIGYQLVAGVHI
jgi:hypothetical protein